MTREIAIVLFVWLPLAALLGGVLILARAIYRDVVRTGKQAELWRQQYARGLTSKRLHEWMEEHEQGGPLE